MKLQTPAERLSAGMLNEFPLEVEAIYYLLMLSLCVKLQCGVAPKEGE